MFYIYMPGETGAIASFEAREEADGFAEDLSIVFQRTFRVTEKEMPVMSDEETTERFRAWYPE